MQLSLFVRLFGRKNKLRHSPAPNSEPELQTLWLSLRREYFSERTDLDTYIICWSGRRQRRVLASVSVDKKVVRVAQELQTAEHSHWLAPLLYHEMCHAILGRDVPRRNGKRSWHGKEFRELEARHPGIKALDEWIRSGGWHKAVRSHRGRLAARSPRRRCANSKVPVA